MRLSTIALLTPLVAISACQENDAPDPPPSPTGGVEARPLTVGLEGGRFTRIGTKDSGVDFTNLLRPENDKKYVYNGSGVATGDFDDDGRVDLYLTSLDGPNRLYRQDGPFHFVDVTDASGTAGPDAWSTGASFVDVDEDGDLDLYVAYLNAADRLFRNDGEGRFTDVSAAAGLAHAGASVMPAFADYDRDGDLDLYLLTNRLFSAAEEVPDAQVRMIDGRPTVHPDFVDHYTILSGHFTEAGQTDRLFRNRGDGTFEDVTEGSGIVGHDMGLSATWLDFDEDGHPDIYVANDMMGPDHLYRNRGDGTFVDVAPDTIPHTSWFSMGSDAADIDGDGHVDLMVGDMSSTTHYKQKTTMGNMDRSTWFLESGAPRQYMRNVLLRNTGTARFMEVAAMAGLTSSNWTWSLRFGDLDSDGHQDLFVTNGHARNANQSDLEVESLALVADGRQAEAFALGMELPPLPERNMAFQNLGDLRFESRGAAWGLDAMGISHGASMTDLDGDGDLDLVVNNLKTPAAIYRNDLVQGHRVTLSLRGSASNRRGVGSRVTVRAGGREHVRELFPAHGYLSSDAPVLHFGLGEATRIESIEIRWPSGALQRLADLPTNQHLTITEPSSDAPPPPEASRPTPLFAQSTLPGHVHRERPFDDYEEEPLLPWKLSQMGPGIAVGDVDADGRDDLLISGAAGTASALLLQSEPGRFTDSGRSLATTTDGEILGALIIEAGDEGGRELLMSAGGTESPDGSDAMADLVFSTLPGAELGSPRPLDRTRSASFALAATDMDRDGQLELFVGGGHLPQGYPDAAPSRILSRAAGGWRPLAAERTVGLEEVGAAGGAVWTDVNGDGWTDLVVASAWGPLYLFINEEGRLVSRTESSGLGALSGMWNGITAADFDGDGDMDLVATNLGLNTKYHASSEHPMTLLVADFDHDGERDLVEVSTEEETAFPSRGLSCSSGAMPAIRERFPTFDAFGRATLEEVYGAETLAEARRLEAAELRHMVFLNDGGGHFEASPLPHLAQASIAFGVVAEDFDADGHVDLVLAQNWFAPQPETGRFDGGLGVFLRGLGDGSFEFVPAALSGVVMHQDASALARGDFDGDGRPDLIVGVNDGAPIMLSNRAADRGRFLRVRLQGPAQNARAIGARIELRTVAARRQLREVRAGHGYLSQSSADVYFGVPAGDSVDSLHVRWPNGETTEHDVPAGTIDITLHP